MPDRCSPFSVSAAKAAAVVLAKWTGGAVAVSGETDLMTDSSPSNPTTNYMTVDPNLGILDITLENANINTNSACPFSIGNNTTVNLTLSGTNTLNASSSAKAGLGVPSGATIDITAASTA
ncbi:hypothetical protein [Desulfosporosinus sp. SB140]|uniref:hypothetical protein n=1 Tax=Desulfosporosinus paludis TaxID=3115649 RepID=UPI003890F671